MNVSVSRKGFYKIIKNIFQETAEIKDGYPILIPIESKHQIYINDLLIFLEKDKQHLLSVNSYGQMSIVKENTDGHRSNHIIFNLSSLNSISFLTKSVYTDINPKTNDYYNEMFRFTLK